MHLNSFWFLRVLYVNLPVKLPDLAQNALVFNLNLFWRAFYVTKAIVSVQSILNKNTWIIHLIKQSKEAIVVKYFLHPRGGQKRT